MAVAEGIRGGKTWIGNYSFATDGGAVGTIVLRSEDGPIPTGSVIYDGGLDITTAALSGSGTMAITIESAADTFAAALQAALTVGRKNLIPLSFATSIKTTASRSPSLVIATGAFTAGAFRLILKYV